MAIGDERSVDRGTVGTSFVRLSSTYKKVNKLNLLALSTNSGTIYFGYSDAVTSSNGYPLIAGAAYDFTNVSASDIYVIGSGAGQNYAIHQE